MMSRVQSTQMIRNSIIRAGKVMMRFRFEFGGGVKEGFLEHSALGAMGMN